MAAYKLETFSIEDGQQDVVLAAIEVQLETLDSTTNVIRLLNVVYNEQRGIFVGVLIYDIA
jgi:hypothetical protein